MASDDHIENSASFRDPLEPYVRELLGAADRARFRKHATCCADFAVEMTAQRHRAFLAQAPGAFLNDVARNLRHARSRRARPWRERKHVQVSEPAFVDEIERTRKHLFGLGRKAGDDVA